jgi:hypothetical protein
MKTEIFSQRGLDVISENQKSLPVELICHGQFARLRLRARQRSPQGGFALTRHSARDRGLKGIRPTVLDHRCADISSIMGRSNSSASPGFSLIWTAVGANSSTWRIVNPVAINAFSVVPIIR